MEVGPVTILVGPNNGGKSTALADLLQFAGHGGNQPYQVWPGGKVISEAEVEGLDSVDEVTSFLADRTHSVTDHHVELRAFSLQSPPGPGSGTIALGRPEIDPANTSGAIVAHRLLQHYTISLNGRQRFELASGRQSGALNGPPTSHWMAVERDDAIYAEVDAMVSAAFGQHLVMQTFQPPQIEPALSEASLSAEHRHSTSDDAINQQLAATPILQLSDGVQVFCGMIAAVAALPHLLLLVDEPEAFLHPTLCRRLGADLARIARERDARLVAATHSSDFLLGCLEEVPDTTVLRLDYRGGTATSFALEATKVAQLSRDPLLRSANALRALFARSAVVCEADADRAFYEEINRRLSEADGRHGATDAVFLNAQNWQTTVRISGPLRAAGVPAAVVVDLDTLVVDEPWAGFVAMGDPVPADRDRVLNARAAARDAINECGRAVPDAPLKVKSDGLDALTDEQRKVVDAAIAELESIGIFPVAVGELEGWLAQLGCTNKQTWVTDMLQRLGAPGDAAYVTPGPNDVWGFVERVAAWLEDPNRSGMPVR